MQVQKSEVVNILNLINEKFYSLWLAEESHIVAKGGRSSMKSSVISLRLVVDFLNDPEGNVVSLRKVGKYLSTSLYEQIKWAIYILKAEDEFTFMKSPLRIVHKDTNTAFYFYGCDDPLKLKSTKIAKGYVMALWFEELAEFAGVEDIDTVEDTFIREGLGDKQVKVYFSFNPPRNPYAWVNEWVDSKRKDDDYLIHHSTYLDDKKGFLSAQIVRKIEKYKESDYDYWRWMYKGEAIGLGDNVYNMNLFQKLDELPDDDKIVALYYGIDTGHQVSATCCLCVGRTAKGKVILLDTYYYSPAGKVDKKAPSELAKDLNEFIKRTATDERWAGAPIKKRTIDSAEGGVRNQYWKDYKQRLHPVAKKKKSIMIDHVHDLLSQGKVYYLDIEANQIVIEEHRKYQWNEKTLKTDNPEVLKVDDHTPDAMQYLVIDNLKDFKLVA